MKIGTATAIRIQELCVERGITINALSYAAGIPRSTIKNILYGKSKNPGVGTIQLICDAMGISLVDFFDDTIFSSLNPYDE